MKYHIMEEVEAMANTFKGQLEDMFAPGAGRGTENGMIEIGKPRSTLGGIFACVLAGNCPINKKVNEFAAGWSGVTREIGSVIEGMLWVTAMLDVLVLRMTLDWTLRLG